MCPTLDDSPTVETLAATASAGGDLIQLYDISQQKAKTMSLDELILYVVANTSATAV